MSDPSDQHDLMMYAARRAIVKGVDGVFNFFKSLTGSREGRPALSPVSSPRVVLISKGSRGYARTFRDAFADALSRVPGARLEVIEATSEDANSFRSKLREAVEREPKPEVLVLLPPPNVMSSCEVVVQALERGIPTICVDQGFESEPFHRKGLIPPALIKVDNEHGGRLAAEALSNYLEEDAEVALVTGPRDSAPSNERKAAFVMAAIEYRWTIAWVQEAAGWKLGGEINAIKKHLQKWPKLGAIFCCNDELAMEVYNVAHSLKLPVSRRIIGFDGIADARQLVENRALLATVDQKIVDQASAAASEIGTMLGDKQKYLTAHQVNIRVIPSLIWPAQRVEAEPPFVTRGAGQG